jgi:hypothetical protein
MISERKHQDDSFHTQGSYAGRMTKRHMNHMNQPTLAEENTMMKIAVSIISVSVLIAMLMTLPIWSEAQPGGRGGKGGRPPGPPEEAVAACEGKNEGDRCEFTSPCDQTISGICRSIEEQLACVPEGGPRGRHPKDDSEGGPERGQN